LTTLKHLYRKKFCFHHFLSEGIIIMKILRLAFFCAIMLLMGKVLAQNTPIMSDTMKVTSSNTYVQLRNFGTLAIGQSECHTIYLQNSTGKALIINSVVNQDLQYGNNDFTVKAIPSMPAILLNGEIVSLADICFVPQPTQVQDTSISLGIMVETNIGSLYGVCAGFEKIDTLLKKPCISLTLNGDVFGPVIMDGDVTQTVTLQSNRYDSLWVTGSDGWKTNLVDPPFSISGITFPYHLAPREVKTFNVTFSPRSNVANVQYRYVGSLSLGAFSRRVDSSGLTHFEESCSYYNVSPLTLAGVAIPPTADSISTSLTAGSTDILAMISDNSVTTQTFHFSNTGTTNLKITDVSLKNGKSFAITNIQPTNTFPFVLTPGQSMSVTISMTTVTNGVYYDEVIITAENAIISINFALQGLHKDGVQADVHKLAADQHIALYPNPSHGMITVTIPDMKNATVEVLDLLGRVVIREKANDSWIWRSNAAPGTYILHVTGTDQSGNSVQSYDRFIIEH
jgi:hypothetical protein